MNFIPPITGGRWIVTVVGKSASNSYMYTLKRFQIIWIIARNALTILSEVCYIAILDGVMAYDFYY
jgi:hypothetical protein